MKTTYPFLALLFTAGAGIAHGATPDEIGEQLRDFTVVDASSPAETPVSLTSWLDDAGLTFYGYIKADAALDSGSLSNGNFGRWVNPGGEDDSQFNITARQTRLGFKAKGPSEAGIESSARFELDFYSTGSENSSNPRMRHAYVNLDFVDSSSSLLFGQTSDVVSPLTTPTINYTILWWSGDIGFRRNQIRYTKTFDLGEGTSLKAVAAATRSISGEGEGGPGFQGRVGLTFPGVGDAPTTIGISGHSAREHDGTASVDSDSLAVDLTVPVASGTTLKAEFHTGNNLDAYLGGVGQGTTAGEEIESTGWWLGLSHELGAKSMLNLGYGLDDPEDADLVAGDRSENSTLFANVTYALNSATSLGFEVGQHETGYIGGADEEALRLQVSATFKF